MSGRRRFIVLAASAALMCIAADAKEIGRLADGRQLIFTAVAITEAGTIGQAPSRDLTVPRAGGDAVSRYGLGMTFAQLPAAALAPQVEARWGAGSSQRLFLIAPFLCVLATAWLAGRAAELTGASAAGETLAMLFTAVASPFWVYGILELSEPLQSFSLLLAFVGARRAAMSSHAQKWGSLAGFAVGIAVLTKSSLLIVAPLALLPMVTTRARARWRPLLGACLAGLLPVLGVWFYFEVTRFGRPFAGYEGEGFTHPFFDGFWRLILGVNKGILIYFPAALVALVTLIRRWRTRDALIDAAGLILPALALLALAAPWWAWHGVEGWGPRLLVPAIPLLAVAAALEMERWPRPAAVAVVAVSCLINLPPLLQHPTPVLRYEWACDWPQDATETNRVPHFAQRTIGGRVVVPPDQILALVPSATDLVTLPWFYVTRHADSSQQLARLNDPPWRPARPDIVPKPPVESDEARTLLDPPAFAVYDAALREQILRAQHLRLTGPALTLAQKLEALAPDGFADALLLETYRLLGRKQDAIAWLTHLPTERRMHPAINVVLALWDRDEGKDAEARQLLATSVDAFRGTPAERALTQPLATWPPDLASMTANPNVQVAARH